MKNVAVILAREGSKGIPFKNIVLLHGRPVIYYTIEASLRSEADEVWVSTDSERIAHVAKKNGAMVLMRPPELATDTASSESALIHFCQNTEADNIIFIQPTSPLLLFSDINFGLEMLDEYDSIFSVYKEHWIPRWQKINSELKEHNWQKEFRMRRQEMPNLLVENGAFYISSKELILKNQIRYSGKIGYYEMPYSRSFQIDTYDDLFVVESILSNQKKGDCFA